MEQLNETGLKEIGSHITATEDGEVLEEKHYSILVNNRKEFYLTFCHVIGVLKDLKEAEIKTMCWLISNLTMNSNIAVVVLGVKQTIGSEMGLSVSSVNRSLAVLVERGLLFKKKASRGMYYINPEYYWKGELAERNRTLKMVLELKQKGELE